MVKVIALIFEYLKHSYGIGEISLDDFNFMTIYLPVIEKKFLLQI